ncbi:MAG: hypothetical protein ACXWDO_07625 [Bacteroidia bacterium]
MPYSLRSILVFIFIFSAISALGQYSDDKKLYDHKSYKYLTSDKYHPAMAGVASYVLPGLGQIYCNETSRGFRFMSGFGGAILVGMTGGVMQIYNDLNGQKNYTGGIILVTGSLTAAGIQIWSTVDAVRVAKVNNLSLRDKSTHSLIILPSYLTVANEKDHYAGLAIRIEF